jgi:hypothetical protein
MKKLSFIAAFLLLVAMQNASAQRLISDTVLARYSASQLTTYFSDNQIPLSSSTGITCYRLIYETENAQGTDSTYASGLLIVPDVQNCPLPIAMYDHGTTLQRTDVPSYLNYEAIVVMIIASEGYYSLAPDYLGLGVSPGFHPYIHARSEAQAGIDLIFAAKQFAADSNVELSQQLFLTGYSQGGHACMATHRAIQENYAGQLMVTASAPGSGPYNMSGIQSAGLANDSFYAEPAYIPFLIFAYQSVYGNLYTNVSGFLQHPWDSILPPLYYAETTSTGAINGMLPNHIDSIIVDTALLSYVNDSATDPLRIDLRDNDVYAWLPQAPILMTYCLEDEQVDSESTLFTYAYFRAEGDTTAQKYDGGPYTHENCVNPWLEKILPYIIGFTTHENNLNLTLTADSATSGNNASVSVSVTGGAGYTISWSTGGTDSTVTGLANGTYTVTVTDAKGCTKVRSITTNAVLGISNVTASLPQMQIFPNPATDQLTIKTTDFIPQHISVYNVNGQLVTETGYTQKLNINNLASGVYLLEVSAPNVTMRSRFIKM